MIRQPWLKFLVSWLATQIVAWALVVPLTLGVGMLSGGLIDPANVESGTASPIADLLALLVIGLGMGVSQYFLLRPYLERVVWWIPATLAGVLAGFALSRLLVENAFMGSDLLIIFPCVAVMQTGVLWCTGRWRALLWLPVKGFALLFTPYMLSAFMALPYEFTKDLPLFISGGMTLLTLSCVVPGVLYAIPTGLLLLWVRHPWPKAASTPGGTDEKIPEPQILPEG